jgi:hypothetical protein
LRERELEFAWQWAVENRRVREDQRNAVLEFEMVNDFRRERYEEPYEKKLVQLISGDPHKEREVQNKFMEMRQRRKRLEEAKLTKGVTLVEFALLNQEHPSKMEGAYRAYRGDYSNVSFGEWRLGKHGRVDVWAGAEDEYCADIGAPMTLKGYAKQKGVPPWAAEGEYLAFFEGDVSQATFDVWRRYNFPDRVEHPPRGTKEYKTEREAWKKDVKEAKARRRDAILKARKPAALAEPMTAQRPLPPPMFSQSPRQQGSGPQQQVHQQQTVPQVFGQQVPVYPQQPVSGFRGESAYQQQPMQQWYGQPSTVPQQFAQPESEQSWAFPQQLPSYPQNYLSDPMSGYGVPPANAYAGSAQAIQQFPAGSYNPSTGQIQPPPPNVVNPAGNAALHLPLAQQAWTGRPAQQQGRQAQAYYQQPYSPQDNPENMRRPSSRG